MPDPVFAKTFGHSLVSEPADRPGNHVVIGRLVHPAMGSGTGLGLMNLGEKAVRYSH